MSVIFQTRKRDLLFIMKNDFPILPDDLVLILAEYSFKRNSVGRSSAGVYRCFRSPADKTFYLKISPANNDIRLEHGLLCWLSGKLPVPIIEYWGEQDGLAYLLTTEIQGCMACNCPEDTVVQPIEDTVRLLAHGLLMLQAVDITYCPFDNTLGNKLAWALSNIQNGLVDMGNWEESNDFETPMALYTWLLENKPAEEVCFTHGDYCLPNVFTNGTAVTGFIDMGRGGIADKWQDISLCVRSLGYNLRNVAEAEKNQYINLLFSVLGIEPDWEKIDYYILLDELF